MVDGGWRKTYRKAHDCAALQPADARGIWEKMLDLAAHPSFRTINWRGQSVDLAPGQCAISVRAFAKEASVSHKRMRGILSRFSREGMIQEKPILGAGKGTASGTVGTLITFCNWGIYNGHDISKGTPQGTAGGTTGAQVGHTKEEYIEGEESKNQTATQSVVRLPPANRIPLQRVAEIWNEVCSDVLPGVREFPKQRAAAARKRLAENFHNDPSEFLAYCQRIRASPFLTGENDRGWVADIDFALRPSSITKVLEGRYDRRTPTRTPRRHHGSTIEAMARIRERRGLG